MTADEQVRETVDLAHLDDTLFQRLYAERIEPCFARNEDARIDGVRQFRMRAAIGAALVLALIAAVWFWIIHDAFVLLVVGFMASVIAWAVAYHPLHKLGRKLKQEYCSAIAEAMGASFSADKFEPPALARFQALRLLPSFQRSQFEDHFHGAHKSASFDLYEAELKQRRTDSKGRTHYSTVFRGQLIRMHFPREFLGVTIVRRDAGVFNVFGGGDAGGRKLERVRLVASEFEKAFEVWGTDQVEGRYLLHPVMMERLIELERGLKGKRIRCAFEGGDLLVAVEGGNLFEPGSMFKPLVDPSRARRIVDEIAGVVRVMDQVLTAQAQRPPAA
jgi:hypothetical protein